MSEDIQEIKELFLKTESILEKIWQTLEEQKPNYKVTGRIDLTGNAFENQLTCWTVASSNLALIANRLQVLDPEFKPQSVRTAEIMERLKNNTIRQ